MSTALAKPFTLEDLKRLTEGERNAANRRLVAALLAHFAERFATELKPFVGSDAETRFVVALALFALDLKRAELLDLKNREHQGEPVNLDQPTMRAKADAAAMIDHERGSRSALKPLKQPPAGKPWELRALLAVGVVGVLLLVALLFRPTPTPTSNPDTPPAIKPAIKAKPTTSKPTTPKK